MKNMTIAREELNSGKTLDQIEVRGLQMLMMFSTVQNQSDY